MNVYFAHGKESGPWGTKITALAAIAESKGFNVISPDYSSELDPDVRVKQLLNLIYSPSDITVLVGSSMGGYVSTVASQVINPIGLFLMAPAFYLPGYWEQNPIPHSEKTVVVHGLNDDVVPVENSIRFAHEHKSELYFIVGDHQLTDQLPKIEVLFGWFLDDILTLIDQNKVITWEQIESKVWFHDAWIELVWRKIISDGKSSYRNDEERGQAFLLFTALLDFYQSFMTEFSGIPYELKQVDVAEVFEMPCSNDFIMMSSDTLQENTRKNVYHVLLELYGNITGIANSIYEAAYPTIYDEDENDYVLDPEVEDIYANDYVLDPEVDDMEEDVQSMNADFDHARAIRIISKWLEDMILQSK